ncbi:MAG: hypothetical protein IH955_08450 [Chloroflexi bacterium]|nr:hypothetical protein [Chloroflexota bacterium]
MAETHSLPDKETSLRLYKGMVTIREFEERARREADSGKPVGGIHSSVGQEAVAVGVCAHLRSDDYLLGTHRSHHHCLAKGVDMKKMMAELMGKATGTNKGKGGTMHIADVTKGMLGANGVVGSNIPVATGVAFRCEQRDTGPNRLGRRRHRRRPHREPWRVHVQLRQRPPLPQSWRTVGRDCGGIRSSGDRGRFSG